VGPLLLLAQALRSRVGFLIVANLVVIGLMSAVAPGFLSIPTAQAIGQYGAALALLALGQTLVVVAGGGGIDLSVGSVLSLTGVVFGLLVTRAHVPWVAAAGLAVASGCGLGAINGLLVTRFRIPPIIATLGTLYLYGSLALVVTNSVPVSGFPASFGLLGQGTVLGVPAGLLLVVAPVGLALVLAVGRTAFGRRLYLTGVNETAASLSGISVSRLRWGVYCLSGSLSAMGAILTASWLMSARPDAGNGYELQSLTVVLLGGTNIFGGSGTPAGTLCAVLIVIVVAQGLQLAGVDPTWQLGILGVLLLLAVALNEFVLSGPGISLRRGLR
jgi:ribose/xylose/arabinose/galactoside ABC-type transport system permease subunit